MLNDNYNHNFLLFPKIPPGGKLFGVIGRLFPDKGHRFFLNAFAGVRSAYPQARVAIVGDGPARTAIEAQIKSMNLSVAVTLCGFQKNMRRVYDQLDFIVMPSLTEGLPYTLLEAMSAKIPIIATTVGDIPSIIQHGKSGYLVPPSDSSALEKSMLAFLENPEHAQAMAEEAQRTLNEQYTAEKMVNETERLYLSLAVDEKNASIL
jgi:glycosyltransferase involved in cell wall biosynthesis